MPKFNVRSAVVSAGLAGALAFSCSAVVALAEAVDNDVDAGGVAEQAANGKITVMCFATENGQFADGSVVAFGETDDNGFAGDLETPTRDGYAFAGWYYDSACTQVVDLTQPLVSGSGHITLYSGWTKVEESQAIDIMYSANGGTFADGGDFQQGVTDADGYARQPLAPTREGYTFAGWFYDSEGKNAVDFDSPIAAGSGHATLSCLKRKNNVYA